MKKHFEWKHLHTWFDGSSAFLDYPQIKTIQVIGDDGKWAKDEFGEFITFEKPTVAQKVAFYY